jgi:hypothetical protein
MAGLAVYKRRPAFSGGQGRDRFACLYVLLYGGGKTMSEKRQSASAYKYARLDELPSESALPDALEGARVLFEDARELEASQAEDFKAQARCIVCKELNELDGFDR